MVRLAVTGGIACGKSRVAQYLQTRGIPVCEADLLGHEALAVGSPVYGDVVAEFGRGILDETGAINRGRLGAIVFAQPERLARLNGLIHPVVQSAIADWLDAQEQGGCAVAAVIVPLLFEVNMAEGWDVIIGVGCSPAVQLARLMGRGLDEEACRQRVAAQMPLAEKMKLSDFEIWNDGSEAQLEERVAAVLMSIEEK